VTNLSDRFGKVQESAGRNARPVQSAPGSPDDSGPQTDDELHAYIEEQFGIDIPRTAVCADHCAPFDAFADLYFERVRSALWLAPRGGAKSALGALWNMLSSKFRARCEGLIAGAIEQQSRRCYEHLRAFIRNGEEKVDTSLKSITTWRNGSQVEIVTGSEASVRGPHPQHVHLDEVDMMDDQVRKTALLMSRSSGDIVAQDLLTSTRQFAHGPMQRLIDEIEEAKRLGNEPPFDLYSWCIYECAANQPGCGETCNCSRVVKAGRSFADVCGGKLKRSGGWISLEDLHKTFLTTDAETWRAEMECGRASTEGLILPTFDRGLNCIRGYLPRAEHGPIFRAVDFGYENPTATVWAQFIDVEGLIATDYNKTTTKREIPRNSFVVFDEVYKAGLTSAQYVMRVRAKDEQWAEELGEFSVRSNFYDKQGAQEAANWRSLGIRPLICPAPKDPRKQTRQLREVHADGLLTIDARCDNTIRELESVRYDPATDGHPHKRAGFDHAFDALRYLIANTKVVYTPAKVAGLPANVTQLRPQAAAGVSPWETAL
jgi:hypothetical protein